MRFAVPLALVCAIAPSAAGQKEFGFDNRQGSGQAYLTPAETVAKFKVAPEFAVKLFAGEPQVVNPVAFSIDERGRVWVLECFEYPSKTPKGKAPRDRVVILEDTDGDGACDTRTVFAEGRQFPIPAERAKAGLPAFDIATGLEVGHGKVWVGAPPYLWTIDITGDNKDKPGAFNTVLSGFGSQDTHETLNTFQWGPDGYLYGMQGVFTQSTVKPLDGPETRMNAAVWRLHPVTKKFEIFAEGTSNPWGMDWRNTDGQFILACCVIPHLYHVVPGGVYKRQAGASYNPHAYDHIQEISDHTFHKESGWAHAGLISLDAPHIPAKYRNSVVFGSIHGCSLKQNILKPDGSSYTASRGDDFLVSGDKNVRPINLKWGPNGDIYLIDWHDQMPCHQARPDQWDYARGRVYRIEVKGRAGKKAEDLGKLSVRELCGLMAGAAPRDPYTSRTALRLLAERKTEVTAADAAHLAGMGNYYAPYALHALGATGQFAGELRQRFLHFAKDNTRSGGPAITPHLGAIVVRAVADADPSADTVERLAKVLAGATLPPVRREIASAALKLGEAQDVTPILHALMAQKADAGDPLIPHLTWLAYEKVVAKRAGGAAPADRELAWLAAAAPGNPFVRDRIVPNVIRRLVATGRADDLARCVGFAASLLTADAPSGKAAVGGLAAALDKQTVPAPAGWPELEARLAGADDLKALAGKLAVNFRDPKAAAAALATAGDAAAAADGRAEAVRRLAALKPDGAAGLLMTLVAADGPAAVRVEAARALAAFDPAAAAKGLLPRWAGLPPAVRAELVAVFAGRKESAKELLTAMAAGLVDRGEVTDNTALKMRALKDAGLDALVESAWGRARSTPADLLATIDRMRAELGAGPASFAKGKLVFEANCAKCHQFDGRGQSVGPALDGAGRDIEYILANVIDPNRVIGAPYFLRTATTLDGRVEQGLLHAEDDTQITLKVENGVLKRIPKADLEGPVAVVEKSMMPEGLTYGMTPQDFRDLVKYLMASPYLSAGTVAGKPVAGPPTGRLPVPAGAVTLTFPVTAAAEVKTTLSLGVAGKYAVTLDGNPVATGECATGGPDRASVPVTVPAGAHTLSLTVTTNGGAVYARLMDPDRKLANPDGK